ncbi:MAG: hypothetical protein ACOYM8_03700 [Caulobacterales bacterium]
MVEQQIAEIVVATPESPRHIANKLGDRPHALVLPNLGLSLHRRNEQAVPLRPRSRFFLSPIGCGAKATRGGMVKG